MTGFRARIRPRSASLTLNASRSLSTPYRVDWIGVEPIVRPDERNVEIEWPAGRVGRARPILSVALNTRLSWALEVYGGVADLHADLRGLQLVSLDVTGGVSDVMVDLPDSSVAFPVRLSGGVSRATIRRPRNVGVDVLIEGGTTAVRVDDRCVAYVPDTVSLATPGDPQIAVHVRGGARRLTIRPGADAVG